MYIPGHFAGPGVEIVHDLMRARPLATLVTLSPIGLNANHIPLHLSPEPGPFGTLRGHVARANKVWQEVNNDSESLAIFQGPEAYISPSWYPTKAETGKVVPTWNYVVAHAYGTLRVIEDPVWIRAHLEQLTAHNEASFPESWKLDDAPADFTEKLIRAVVGVEMVITRLDAKWKTSQNQPARNQAGVVNGLRERGDSDAVDMADLIEGINPARQTVLPSDPPGQAALGR